VLYGDTASDAYLTEQGQFGISVIFSDGVRAAFLATWDADGDGIPDEWERQGGGIDVNGDGIIDLDLYGLGARPDHKDLFVEVDAMSTVAPQQGALDDVVAAFAAVPNSLVNNPDGQGGIVLHIIQSELNLPTARWTSVGVFPPAFDVIKAAHFGNPTDSQLVKDAKSLVFRYCEFVVNWTEGPIRLSSGRGELPGNDFMVSLGLTRPVGGTRQQQAGTFMHEMGHTLGLHHGGTNDDNWKPNFHSVMNYLWQFPATGTPMESSWRLDYSRTAFTDLNEAALNENAGIGGDAAVTTGLHDCNNPVEYVPEGGFVDFNQNGVADLSVSRDLNWSCSIGVLTGYKDWDKLQYSFRSLPTAKTGVHGAELVEELDWRTFNRYFNLSPCGSSDFNGDGDYGTDADIEAFMACLAGNCCTLCQSVDFDGDGDEGTDFDIEAFFRILAGGPC